MTRLKMLIEVNKMGKENRSNEKTEKLKQLENFSNIKKFFDPLTKKINCNKPKPGSSSQHNFKNKKTLQALEDNTNVL